MAVCESVSIDHIEHDVQYLEYVTSRVAIAMFCAAVLLAMFMLLEPARGLSETKSPEDGEYCSVFSFGVL